MAKQAAKKINKLSLFRISWGVVISQHMGYSEVSEYIILNIRCQNVQFYTLSRYRFFKNKSSNH